MEIVRIVALISCLICIVKSKSALVWDKDHLHATVKTEPHAGRHGDFVNPAGKGLHVDWKALGKKKIEQAAEQVRKIAQLDKPAKNVIFMMGDGMGVSTLTAARIYLAQTRNVTGEDVALSWEKMPHAALAKTYATDYQTADSAATATAMVCGEKTSNDVVACNQDAIYDNCSSQAGTETPSILHHAIGEGRWTGVISTARVTHASPACTYAHAVNRAWESDSDLPNDAVGVCPDIASQFIDLEPNEEIRVLLGGGRSNFFPDDVPDEEYPNQNGSRSDGRDLVQEWMNEKESREIPPSEYKYVNNEQDFKDINPEQIQYLFGLFEPSHMQYELDRPNDGFGEPSIAEMVEKSIKILEKSEKGYFLFVEGGRVDHAHHDNNAQRALGDAVALSDAVQRAMDLTSEDDTLIVVTADHSHVFTISGYSRIDTNIFQYDVESQIAEDDKPYTTLGYTNGPGYYFHRTKNGSIETSDLRMDQSEIRDDMINIDFVQDAGVPRGSETHGGEDVAVFARGPMAHLFMGTQEQSYIGNLMMYAMCVGDNKDLCENPPEALGCTTNNSIQRTSISGVVVTIFSMIFRLAI